MNLLQEARAQGCEFGPALANHLPMVLVALARLGASDARLAAYAEAYRAANPLRPPPPTVAAFSWHDWTTALGDRTRETDYRIFFGREMMRLGPAELQRRTLPTLLPGIAASALHALMRLAYAHLADAPEEVATALAYWAATHLPLRQNGGTPDTTDATEILARLRRMPHLLDIRPESDLLWHAIRAVGQDERFAAELDRFSADASSMRPLAAVSLTLFAGAGDFCSLHALTSMHWLRLLPPDIVGHGTALRHLWRALAAVYPKMGMPELPTPGQLDRMRHAPCPEWPQIAAAAVASDDEHDISLVFSAREEEDAWADTLYRRVAAARMGLTR